MDTLVETSLTVAIFEWNKCFPIFAMFLWVYPEWDLKWNSPSNYERHLSIMVVYKLLSLKWKANQQERKTSS